MDAAAMRDLGLFGSLMLVGTIIFVLVFLPVFAKRRNNTRSTLEIGRLLPEEVPFKGWTLVAVLLVTVVMVFLSRRTSFDSDMQNINYMTAEQRSDLALLQGGISPEGKYELYSVAEGKTLQEAVRVNDEITKRLEGLVRSGDVTSVKGIGDMIPGEDLQKERISRWNSFWSGGRKERLLSELEKEAPKAGFSESAFALFGERLSREYSPQDASSEVFLPASEVFRGTYLLSSGGKVCILSKVGYDDPSLSPKIKETLTGGIPSAMSFGTADISNQLAKVLSESFDWIGSICGLVVFIFLCLSMRRLELAVLSFLPLAFGWYWILGTMGLLGIKFNVVVHRHHARHRERLADVPRKMAPRALRDALRLARIGRDAALHYVVDGYPPASYEERPKARGKSGADVVGVSGEEVHGCCRRWKVRIYAGRVSRRQVTSHSAASSSPT